MKTKALLSAVSLLICGAAAAQFSAGLNASMIGARVKKGEVSDLGGYSTEGGIEMEPGPGGELYVKYLFSPKIEAELAAGHYIELPRTSKGQMSTLSVGGNFMLFTKTVRPYIGLDITALRYRYAVDKHTYYDSEGNIVDYPSYEYEPTKYRVVHENYMENEFGLSLEPSAGILFDSGIIENLFINTQASLSFDLTGDNIWQYYRVNLGLVYYILGKETE